MSLPAVAFGIVSSRRRSTRSAVARSDGAVVGVVLSTAAVPSEFTSGSVTDLTPDVCLIAFLRSCSRGSVAGCSSCLRLSADCCLILSSCLSSPGCTCDFACSWACAGGTPCASSPPAICCSLAVACLFALSFWSCSSELSLSRFFWSGAAGLADRSTLISSGPFAPGPNAAVIPSYARRASVLRGSAPLSCWPR